MEDESPQSIRKIVLFHVDFTGGNSLISMITIEKKQLFFIICNKGGSSQHYFCKK